MANHLPVLFVVLFALQGIGTIAYLILMARLFTYLKLNQPDTYTSLGCPSMVLNNNMRNGWLVLGWLWRTDFLDAQDPALTRRASAARTTLVSLLANFAFLIAIFLAYCAFSRGNPV